MAIFNSYFDITRPGITSPFWLLIHHLSADLELRVDLDASHSTRGWLQQFHRASAQAPRLFVALVGDIWCKMCKWCDVFFSHHIFLTYSIVHVLLYITYVSVWILHGTHIWIYSINCVIFLIYIYIYTCMYIYTWSEIWSDAYTSKIS